MSRLKNVSAAIFSYLLFRILFINIIKIKYSKVTLKYLFHTALYTHPNAKCVSKYTFFVILIGLFILCYYIPESTNHKFYSNSPCTCPLCLFKMRLILVLTTGLQFWSINIYYNVVIFTNVISQFFFHISGPNGGPVWLLKFEEP